MEATASVRSSVAPRPATPIHHEAVDGDAVTFAWPEVPGAAAYWLQIAADEGFTDLRFNARVEEPSITLFYLFSKDDATYHWRVRYLPKGGRWRPFSDAEAFRTVSARTLTGRTQASVPAPIAPVNGAPVDAASVPFRWTLVEGAADYRLHVAADERFEETVFDMPLGPCTSMTLFGLLPDTGDRFFWRVQAKQGSGWGAWSDTATFRPVRDAVAEAYAVKQEAARAEADREAARRAQDEAAVVAEAEAPYHRGTTSRLSVLLWIYILVFSFVFTLYIIIAAT